MSESYYQVICDGKVLATMNDLDDAFLFMKAYIEKYYNEAFDLTIRKCWEKAEKSDEEWTKVERINK